MTQCGTTLLVQCNCARLLGYLRHLPTKYGFKIGFMAFHSCCSVGMLQWRQFCRCQRAAALLMLLVTALMVGVGAAASLNRTQGNEKRVIIVVGTAGMRMKNSCSRLHIVCLLMSQSTLSTASPPTYTGHCHRLGHACRARSSRSCWCMDAS